MEGSETMNESNRYETDVLIIGGGMAGCFAAIKAREKNVRVTLVEKGYVSSSGQTPYANSFTAFNESWGHNFQDWMDQINKCGDYLNNRNWTEIILRKSFERFEDLVGYGAEYAKNNDGTPKTAATENLGPCKAVFLDEHIFPQVLRKKVLTSGAEIKDRIMITDLLKDKGRVVGAIGIAVSDAKLCVFKAKSVVICTGAVGFKPTGWPISNLTADGDMMAYRAGAQITGKEFIDTHGTNPKTPSFVGPIFLNREIGSEPPPAVFFNAENETITSPSLFHLGMEFEIHKGKGPILGEFPHGLMEIVGGASAGMSTHKSEGIRPVGLDGYVGVDGLYAAGDSLGIMLCGAAYASIGLALAGSAVTGAIAGETAAENALKSKAPEIDEELINKLSEIIYSPMKRSGGFSPSWIIQLVQNTMIPYFVMIIKKEDRLKAALTNIEFYKNHLVPKMKAHDAHELRLAIEAKNIVYNAEMKLRASLLREESRGTHYREDYPTRDSKNWHVWINIKEVNGEMELTKEPIPKEWMKDEKEEYLFEFPKF